MGNGLLQGHNNFVVRLRQLKARHFEKRSCWSSVILSDLYRPGLRSMEFSLSVTADTESARQPNKLTTSTQSLAAQQSQSLGSEPVLPQQQASRCFEA